MKVIYISSSQPNAYLVRPERKKKMVSNHQDKLLEEPTRQSLVQRMLESLIRKSDRPKSLRELGMKTLLSLPSNIGMIRSFMKALNWREAQGEVPEAGTTRTLVRTDFGPFTLIDTPGHLPELMESGMDLASVIVFLIDATKGLQAKDRELYETVKKMNKPTILVVNKVDALPGEEWGDRLANEVAVSLGVAGVIPVSGRTGRNVAEELIPAMIDASPEAALVIGRELPTYRRSAAQRIIRNATLVSLAAGLEPFPLVDIPILLGNQIRLVLRLAALYGETIDAADTTQHLRELIAVLAGGLGLRYLAEQVAKAVPFGGDFISGAIAGAGTWAMGQVVLEYYEGGKKISPQRMRMMYSDFYNRFRRQRTAKEWSEYVSDGQDTPLEIEAPG